MNRESEKRETRRDEKISDTRANRREDRERGVQREKEEGHNRWEGKGVRKRCTKDRDKKVLTSWIHRLCSLERVGGKDLA